MHFRSMIMDTLEKQEVGLCLEQLKVGELKIYCNNIFNDTNKHVLSTSMTVTMLKLGRLCQLYKVRICTVVVCASKFTIKRMTLNGRFLQF
jgi:hypothetical protein